MVVCPSCGAANPAKVPTCANCGSPLSGHPPRRETGRLVTIVTSDWKGSTSLGEKLDVESLRDLQTRYFDEMQLVFEAHGGRIEKIIGDALVAVFGLPVEHEHDALRGVAAAAESLRTLANLNEQFEQAFGVRLDVRTGIATGHVAAGELGVGEHVLTGEAVRLATAMEQNAPANEALIAPSTYALTRDLVEVVPVPPFTPKGMTEPIQAYRLVALTSDAEQAVRDEEASEAASGAESCTTCGHENPPGRTTCRSCGARLAAPGQAAERRKTVTLVFANARPVTETGAPPSPEALRLAMTDYFDLMRRILEKHGATVEKFIGDAVMAVFGLPVLHEDDALRATRAALEMQAALPGLNGRLVRTAGCTVQVQVGVNTGEVIAGDASLGQRLVTGDAVNTAARLEQVAAPGEVLIGELTHRLVRDVSRVEPVEPLTLKGKAELVPAYRLLTVERVAAEGFRRRQDTPMVGREHEMGLLSEAFLRARNERGARMALVVADAGTGKSRLIREFVDACDADAVVLRGRCLPYGEGITFWPLVEAARSAASIGADDSPDVARAKVRAMISDPEVAERIASAIGLTTTQYGVAEIFWATRKMLEQLGQVRTPVWVIDDIHWAEQTLLDLIVFLLEQSQAPALVLCSARHDLLEKHPDWGERQDSVRMLLKPLSDADAGQIVQNLLGKTGIAGAVRDRIVTAAEGNPLYVEQMLSMLIDSGGVRMIGDQWEPAVDLSEMVVPPTIQALLAARLDLLAQGERSVIEPASVIGQEFATAAIEELVSAGVRPEVTDDLQSMSRKQLVRPATSANAEDASFRFMHILIKDAAYGGLLKRARASLHERFVAWAERVNRERGRSQEFEEIQGYHLEQAYRYLGELGPIDAHGHEVGLRATALLSSAGRRALGRGDAPAAVNLLRRAAACCTRTDVERLPILLDLAHAMRELGLFDEALEVLRDATESAAQLGQDGFVRKARLVERYIEVYAGKTDGAEDWTTVARRESEQAIEVFGATDDEDGLFLAWRLESVRQAMANRWGDMANALENALRHAFRAGRESESRNGPSMAIALLYGPTPVPEAIQRCEDLAARSTADQIAFSVINDQLAQLYAMQGDFERARALYRQGRATLEDLGAKILAASSSMDASRVELLAGDYQAAAAELRRGYDELSAAGEKYLLSTVGGLLARALALQGKLDEAQALTHSMEKLAAPDDVDAQAIWRGVRARILAERGEADEARAFADQAVSLRRESDSPALLAEALADLAYVDWLADDGAGCELAVKEARTLLAAKGDRVSLARLESGPLMRALHDLPAKASLTPTR